MGPKSRTLFHFTRSLDLLKGILNHGFFPSYSLEDTRYVGVAYCALPMCCFCDIPIARIQEHTSFYGEYGFGMTKDWGAKNALEPILYIPSTGTVANFINHAVGVDPDNIHADSKAFYDNMMSHLDRIIALTKPLSGQILLGGKPVEKDFYQENEWRYVPNNYELLSQEEFEGERDARNSDLEKYALKFSPNNVKYIFVKTDSEIPIIFDFIQNNLGHWPLNELKILSSRITSLETLAHDL